MTDRLEGEDISLPPELVELDAELASIRYEERPSFGPELKAELAREWERMEQGGAPSAWEWPGWVYRRRGSARTLFAASLAALLLAGLAVPSARASLIRWAGALRGLAQPAETPTDPPSVPLVLEAAQSPAVPEAAEADEAPPSGARMDPPPEGVGSAPYRGPVATLPELTDRPEAEALIREHYPRQLQRAGIGGTVRLLLWVDSLGEVDFVNMRKGSGVADLDRAALQVAPSLHFDPARRRGRPVGTWVEFDVRFQPQPLSVGPVSVSHAEGGAGAGQPDAAAGREAGRERPESYLPPEPSPAAPPVPGAWEGEGPGTLDLDGLPVWEGPVSMEGPVSPRAADLLGRSLEGAEAGEALGPPASLLLGEVPPGMGPTRWRREASRVLQRSMDRDPDNPAPFLALARIRRKQGLRTEARVLLERGLQRVQRAPDRFPSDVVAALHYERGALLRDSWRGSRRAGFLPAEALPPSACAAARSSGGALSGRASTERLIAWNYLCPERLDEAFARAFRSGEVGPSTDEMVMAASFRAAVAADPAHPGANVELLLSLADEGRWPRVLNGARDFLRASRGHPYGFLLSGLALQRMGRSEEAERDFRYALRSLPPEIRTRLQDVRSLLTPRQREVLANLPEPAREAWVARFWRTLDPILSTEVNERRVEHLARAAYALLRFGATDTDSGEVWMRYGRPEAVRVVGDGDGARTEFWDYGSGPDVTFRASADAPHLALTPEGRSYVDELAGVFPHRYGSGSRLVYALPAQVARFRGRDRGTLEIDVFTRVPPLLATGAGDTLEVGAYVLGADGIPLGATRRRIQAVEGPVTLAAPAGAEAAAVAVELYHAGSGRAVSVRRNLGLSQGEVATATAVGISDLLLTPLGGGGSGEGRTHRAKPEDVRRRAPWMAPYRSAPIRAGEGVGAYFELYGLGRSASYRLRAEVLPADGGPARPVTLRPAGEDGFRTEWARTAPAPGPVREFVDVALGDVPSGRGILRVFAELPEQGRTLTAEREIIRR